MNKESVKTSNNWHSLTIEKVYEKLRSHSLGLNQEEVSSRLIEYGPNELISEKKESAIKLFFGQFLNLLIIILIIAAAISFMTGDKIEALSIIIIVVLAGVLGFIQEFQAGKAIDSLKKMASPRAHVVRNGEEMEILSGNIVPGDIIILKTGDKIPADGRLIESNNLRVEESSLTGESLSSNKTNNTIPEENVPLGDRKNLVYMGTAVSFGRGKAIVTSTGMDTEFGKIATMLQSTENRKTPLQLNLDELGKKLGIFSIVLAGLMSAIGLYRMGIYDYEHIAKMFTWGVALAVAVIPEALPAVVTISLALGVRRMVKRRALVRRLPAVETLGATNIICSDKTGTLTQDAMTIRKVFIDNKILDVTGGGYKPEGQILDSSGVEVKLEESTTLYELLKSGVLCSDTILKRLGDGEWDIMGDPTEGALVVLAEKVSMHVEIVRAENTRIDEIPFSSETKRMTTVNLHGNKTTVYSKGAVEVLLNGCEYILEDGKPREITNADFEAVMNASIQMSNSALRILALTKKIYDPRHDSIETVEKGMTFIGVVGMFDPPRMEVAEAIKTCFAAGIRPIMITGDHKATAVAVAKELGIMKKENALSGTELEMLSDDQFDLAVDNTVVYARISPAHKMKIVETLMRKGNIVAMTGDGVNDAPSLKKSDIGIAMGITGTDVSKEAADMILTDDNFASIVNAIEEGRSIFENIRKYLVFLLSGNMGTVFALVFTMLADLPIPLSAVQILFINFIMDGLIAIALGVEPPEYGIMTRKPRNVKEGILNRDTLVYIGFIGGLIAFVTIGVYVWGMNAKFDGKVLSDVQKTSMFFYALIFARLVNAFNCRSLEQSAFKAKLFSNKALLISVFFTLTLSVGIMMVPSLQKAFTLEWLPNKAWIGLIAASSIVLLIVEVWKMLIRSNSRA